MRRLITVSIASVTLLFGCKKDTSNEPTLALNHFTIGGTEYTAAIFSAPYYWSTAGTNPQSIRLYGFNFSEGKHRIVFNYLSDTTGIAINVRVPEAPGSVFYRTYAPSGWDGKEVTIHYEGGSMYASFPKVWCAEDGTSKKDSVEVSAYLKEHL